MKRLPGKLGKLPKSEHAKLVPIKDHPGLYTFTNIDRDPESEKKAQKLVDEIIEKAKDFRSPVIREEKLRKKKWWHIF